jgi:hypothetical protein
MWVPEGKNRENSGIYRHDDYTTPGNKSKNWQMELHQIKNFLHIQRNNYQIQETTHRMGENLHQGKRISVDR